MKEAEEKAKEYYAEYCPYDKKYEIKELLYELNNRRELKLPPKFSYNLKGDEDEIISFLRETLKNNTTFISLVLNQLFPKNYLFYRTSMLENEIFAGFEFFSDLVEEFQFPFSKIGRGKAGFDNYFTLNKALLSFTSLVWPDLKDQNTIQQRIHYFLYQGLGNLFSEKNDYNRYWIMATGEAYFDDLDNEPETIWSGRKEMQEGDLVFMYRQTPRKAITDLYRVSAEPCFDPYAAWDGFWVDMKKLTQINDVTMVEMKHDDILNMWNFVRCSSQGVTTASIPHFIYNNLLEKMDKDLLDKYNLEPEPVAKTGYSGQFSSETEFEEEVIEPLLKRWGFKYSKQYPCKFIIGSQHHGCQVDFLVRDEKGNVTLFENKLRIVNEKELSKARLQAKSYSLQLGINNFVVASPEGFWLYTLERNKETLVENIYSDKLKDNEDRIRGLILTLRK